MKTSIRSEQASVRSHQCGNAAVMGQGVQPRPPERHPPQRVREGRGEPNPVGPRQRARRPKPPSGVWGAQPRRRAQARLPAVGSGAARVAREASQGRASSPAPQAKQHWARSEQGGAATTAGSRACAAPPEHAARRALEAVGREARVKPVTRGVQPRDHWGIGPSRLAEGQPSGVTGLACVDSAS